MGEVADATGIQFRLLNTSRGPAVWSPRAQCDKKLYRMKMKEVLEQEPNLYLKQGEVAGLLMQGGRAAGVALRDGRTLSAGRHRGDYRHLSEWKGAHWRGTVQLRPKRGSGIACIRGCAAGCRAALDAIEKRVHRRA